MGPTAWAGSGAILVASFLATSTLSEQRSLEQPTADSSGLSTVNTQPKHGIRVVVGEDDGPSEPSPPELPTAATGGQLNVLRTVDTMRAKQAVVAVGKAATASRRDQK